MCHHKGLNHKFMKKTIIVWGTSGHGNGNGMAYMNITKTPFHVARSKYCTKCEKLQFANFQCTENKMQALEDNCWWGIAALHFITEN